MPGYTVATAAFRVGASEFHVRSLGDRQQFDDDDGRAARAGISSASWPIFGQLWPCGRALAEEMDRFPIEGKTILEVGCGLGLASMVLKRRGADITACDHHPLAGEFLLHNTNLNGLAPIAYRTAEWAGPNPTLGRFDLIIGSDLLYERDHPALLANFLACHAQPRAQVLLADPGRGGNGRFGSQMAAQGYTRTARRVSAPRDDGRPAWAHLFSFVRGAAPSG